MNFKLFLKEKAITILLLLFSIITIEIFLMAYNVGMFIKIYIPLIIMGLYVVSIAIEYFKKKKFYDNLSNMLEELEEKYLITELIEEPQFIEGKIMVDAKSGDLLYGITMNFRWGKNSLSAVFFVPFFCNCIAGNGCFQK